MWREGGEDFCHVERKKNGRHKEGEHGCHTVTRMWLINRMWCGVCDESLTRVRQCMNGYTSYATNYEEEVCPTLPNHYNQSSVSVL